jgi:hypothetical protein
MKSQKMEHVDLLLVRLAWEVRHMVLAVRSGIGVDVTMITVAPDARTRMALVGMRANMTIPVLGLEE